MDPEESSSNDEYNQSDYSDEGEPLCRLIGLRLRHTSLRYFLILTKSEASWSSSVPI